ncbi:MAG TPA: VTT domain-containing protein [Vicinamibacterales bacterium]|nr:VTT domain-containing protein [Vicinamibacterales bacterium]
MIVILSLFFGTFLTEDTTCVAAGVLVQQGRVGATTAVVVTALGIYLGDLALWAVGRVAGQRARRWPVLGRHLNPERLQGVRDWFNARAATLMLASRMLPGSRLPLYLAAGAAGGTFRQFALWSGVAVGLWTPAVVLASASSAGMAAAVTAALMLRFLLRGRARVRVLAVISRAWRWEFWPTWLFYPPVALWTVLLALRYRGFGTVSAANPGIPDGGIVGESKYEILRRLPPDVTVPSWRLAVDDLNVRVAAVESELAARGWSFPLVLKPDVGQRGVGVRTVRSTQEAREYLVRERGAVLVQPYDPGPFEAGVFYYRKPHWPRGLILSVTDKRFPVVTGNGASTIEDLIWADPRLRMQAKTFLARLGSARARVPAAGERVTLARAGNHAQGTMFLRGSHLLTAALESRIDAIARSYPGFFIGRFDIRYRDEEAFKAGRDFAIVELNGATAEATDLYDPSRSLWSAYRILFRQWALVFEIGAANRAGGAATSSPARLARLLCAHLISRPANALSD